MVWEAGVRVDEAKRVAREWVLEQASERPGFQGAYVAGSVNWLPDDAELDAASDLDVHIVFDKADATERYKLVRGGVLLEIVTDALDLLRSPEQVLGHYALAGAFRVPSVIVDRTGHLTTLQQEVTRRFAEPAWVRRRCEDALDRSRGYLDALTAEKPLYLQAIVWAFGTSVTTLVPLIACLRNPTVRRRYVAVRELLMERGRPDLYERLLGLLGCADIERRQVKHHLAAVASLYDACVPVLKGTYPFAADISHSSRYITIDGSRDLIERGLHREVVWWLVVTFARCLEVATVDAPSLVQSAEVGLRALLADLGIASFADFQASAVRTRAFLPALSTFTEELIAE